MADRNLAERWICEECRGVLKYSDEHVITQHQLGICPEVRVHPECRIKQLEKIESSRKELVAELAKIAKSGHQLMPGMFVGVDPEKVN